MQTFTRTRMTSGVALIGASVIALSPIVVAPQQVHLPAIPVSSIATTLTASVDPISEWVQVLTATFNNLSALGQQVQSDPAPILAQIIANQIGYATTISTALATAGGSLVTGLTALPQLFLQAAQQLAAGQVSGGLNTAFQAVLALVQNPALDLLPLLDIPGQVLQNLTNVVKTAPSALVYVGLSALSTVNGVASAFEDTAQAVVDAVGAADFGAAVNAIVNAPAVLTNAFLNGYPSTGAVGILSPISAGFPGAVGALFALRDLFAQALGAPVPSTAAAFASPHAAAALPKPAATVTLDTTPATASPRSTGSPRTTAGPRTAGSAGSAASTLRAAIAPSAASAKATPAASGNTGAGSANNAQPTPAQAGNSHDAAAGGATGSGSSARKAAHANRTH